MRVLGVRNGKWKVRGRRLGGFMTRVLLRI